MPCQPIDVERGVILMIIWRSPLYAVYAVYVPDTLYNVNQSFYKDISTRFQFLSKSNFISANSTGENAQSQILMKGANDRVQKFN